MSVTNRDPLIEFMAEHHIDFFPDMDEDLAKDFLSRVSKSATKITHRADTNPKSGVSEYGKVHFADPVNKKYPIDTPGHIRAAWSYINNPRNSAKYSPAEAALIKKRIRAAARGLGKSDSDNARGLYELERTRNSVRDPAKREMVRQIKRRMDADKGVRGFVNKIVSNPVHGEDEATQRRQRDDLLHRTKQISAQAQSIPTNHPHHARIKAMGESIHRRLSSGKSDLGVLGAHIEKWASLVKKHAMGKSETEDQNGLVGLGRSEEELATRFAAEGPRPGDEYETIPAPGYSFKSVGKVLEALPNGMVGVEFGQWGGEVHSQYIHKKELMSAVAAGKIRVTGAAEEAAPMEYAGPVCRKCGQPESKQLPNSGYCDACLTPAPPRWW